MNLVNPVDDTTSVQQAKQVKLSNIKTVENMPGMVD